MYMIISLILLDYSMHICHNIIIDNLWDYYDINKLLVYIVDSNVQL